MSAIDKFQIEKEIARLDGFLSGISLRNGRMGDYSAGAYLIEVKIRDRPIEEYLKEYYKWLPSLAINDAWLLERGMQDLESEIRPFLVRGLSNTEAGEVPSMQRYLSFMVMERISSAIADNYSNVLDVSRMSNTHEPMASKCEYFCLRLEKFLIFMQFNDDIEFREGQRL
jgi:hypothetical protein